MFLDEIGEMPVFCQVKLLRVLQESAVRLVGGLLEVPVNVRVIAANRNLAHEINLGRFRQDLFYRIAVLTIHTPALRQRIPDIPLLIQFFLTGIGSQNNPLPPKIVALASYTWPGNVRQLRHVIERLTVSLNGESRITLKSVKQVLNELSSFESPSDVPHGFRENDSLDDFMARTLLGLYNHYLALTGNHSEVARIFRTNRNTLYERIARARERLQANEFASAHS